MEDKTGTQISILSDEMKNCDVLGIPWLLGLPWYNLGAEGTVMLFGKTLQTRNGLCSPWHMRTLNQVHEPLWR